ncbi:MAG: topoisomerase IV, partial [Epulopiscium sp.]|nr:topoisomerase IV [Candidatus Epulonipiscium sp.]
KLVDLIKTGKIKEISDIRDETDLGGLKLTLDLKRNTDPDELIKKLYTLTPLEDSFNCNFNILIDGHPRVMGIKEILSEWIKFRITCIRNKSQFEIERKSEKLHLLLGLKQILLDIDKAIQIIRDTEKEKDVVPNLMAGFKIDEKQAEFIAEIKLRNLNREYILNRIGEADSLRKEIDSLSKLIQDDKKIKKVIEKELQRIDKEYGGPRKSEIIEEEKITTISKEDLIDDYGVKIFLTEQQYIKKISLASYRANSNHALKDGDRILQEIEVNNKGDILLFSNKQNVYRIKAYELEDSKASTLGDYIPNVLELEEDENIIFISEGNTYTGFILIAFENGKLIKIPLKYYETKQYRRKLVGGFYGKSQCIRMLTIMEDMDILLIRNDGKAALINTNLVPVGKQRRAAGIQSMKMTKKSFLKVVLTPDEFADMDIRNLRANELPTLGKSVNTQLKLNL